MNCQDHSSTFARPVYRYSPEDVTPPDPSLVMQLCHLAKNSAGNPDAPEQITAAFMLFSPKFIHEPHVMEGPLASMARLWEEAIAIREIGGNRLLHLALSNLSMSLAELRQYIHSATFRHDLDRLWQTYYALSILPSFHPQLLSLICKKLIMAKALETLIDCQLYRSDRYEVGNLLRATVEVRGAD